MQKLLALNWKGNGGVGQGRKTQRCSAQFLVVKKVSGAAKRFWCSKMFLVLEEVRRSRSEVFKKESVQKGK